MKKKARKTSDEAASRKLASDVLKIAELVTVRIEGCVADKNLRDEAIPQRVLSHVSVSFGIDRQNNAIHLDVHLGVTGLYEDTPGDTSLMNLPFKLITRFRLIYRTTGVENLTDEHTAAFAEHVGIHTAWPYWREFAQSMTVRMGLPPLLVPAYSPQRFQAVFRKSKDLDK